MKKYLLIGLLLLMPFAISYTIVDYDTFDYYGVAGDNLTAYGWLNKSGGTTWDLSLNYVDANGVHICRQSPKRFNQVNESWYGTLNGSVTGEPLNFSVRYTIKEDIAQRPHSSANYGSVQSGQSLSGFLPISPITRYYLNVSNNGQFNVYHNVSLPPIYTQNHPLSPSVQTFSIQEDFVMVNYPNSNYKQVYSFNVYIDGVKVVDNQRVNLTTTGTIMQRHNATMFRATQFAHCLYFDDFAVIYYLADEPFITPSESLINTTQPQCNNSIDDDDDTYIDYPEDPSCSGYNDTSESPNDYHECSDTLDNDLDKLIDYPQDPSCTDANSTENFTNLYQCNDGADNDVDGLIDYPNDPSCSNYSDNIEYPADASTQPNDECSLADNCVFKETFPYNDKFRFHGWTDLDNAGIVQNEVYNSKNMMKILNIAPYNLNMSKQFANNPTYFSEITGKFQLYFPTITEDASFYVIFKGNTDADIALKIKVAINNSAQSVSFYSVDAYNNEYLAYTQYKGYSVGSYIPLDFKVNNAFGTYTLTDGVTEYSFLLWQNVSYDRLRIEASASQMNYGGNLIYLHSIEFTGVPQQTTCTSFQPPYYLKEQFISGKLTDCGWKAYPTGTIMTNGLYIDDALPYFYAYKQMYDTTTGKYTSLTNSLIAISFQFKIDITNTNNNIFTLSLLDSKSNKFIGIYLDNNAVARRVSDNDDEYFNGISGTTHTAKLIIDLSQDKFNVYLDGSLQQSSLDFDTDSLDITELTFVMLESSYSNYIFSNLEVYLTDSMGNPLPQSQVTPVTTQDNGTTLFGLLFKTTPSCLLDTDCLSGKCGTISKQCSPYNFKACDEHGYNRTGWCFVKLLVGEFFKWVGDVILNNFLYFIMFLILLMILVYFGIMFRRGG